MKIKLIIKEKSAEAFLTERLLSNKSENYDRNGMPFSAYLFLHREIFFKKECGIGPGEAIRFELFDRGHMSGKELINTYTYIAENYDDVAIKLVCKDFSVCLKNNTISND